MGQGRKEIEAYVGQSEPLHELSWLQVLKSASLTNPLLSSPPCSSCPVHQVDGSWMSHICRWISWFMFRADRHSSVCLLRNEWAREIGLECAQHPPPRIIPSSRHTRSGQSSLSSVILGCKIFKWLMGDVGMCSVVQLLLFGFNLTPGESGTSWFWCIFLFVCFILFLCWVRRGWAKTLPQFSSVAQSCLTLCNLVNLSMPGLSVHHQLLNFTQTHVHRVGDAIQPSHPLSSPSPPAPNPSRHPLRQCLKMEQLHTPLSEWLQLLFYSHLVKFLGFWLAFLSILVPLPLSFIRNAVSFWSLISCGLISPPKEW